MTRTPARRAIALFLVAQPVFWASNVTYAQLLEPSRDYGMPSTGSDAEPGSRRDGELQSEERRLFEDRGRAGERGGTDRGSFGERGPSGERGGLSEGVPALETEGRRERGLLPEPRAPVDEPVDPDRYVLGPGDLLELNLWGVQNLRMRVIVDVEGRAFVPRVGYFTLEGKTLTQGRQLMRASIGRLYPRLSFDVTLAEPRTFLVQVVDDVGRPGSYPARATDRVATVIARAGGFGPNASRRRVEVKRRDGKVVAVDLLRYARTGDVSYNPHLLDGDVIRVPFEEVVADIGGAVNRPGRYELVATRDLAELVELAGGLSPTATQLLPIIVVRRGEDDREDLTEVRFVDGRLPAVVMQREDRVQIPSAAELQQSVLVVGAVVGATPSDTVSRGEPGVVAARSLAPEEASATRRLPFVKGDTVRTLIGRAGGVGPLADLTGSYILRGGQAIPVDLYALVMLRDFRADLAVELGDTLVIPFKRRNVLVEGSVLAPGSYPYNPAYSVDQYLSVAGGRSRNAQDLDNVRVVTPRGETKEYQPDLKVEPGSSIVVPERNFSRAEVVQIVISAASILVSAVAVVIAARR